MHTHKSLQLHSPVAPLQHNITCCTCVYTLTQLCTVIMACMHNSAVSRYRNNTYFETGHGLDFIDCAAAAGSYNNAMSCMFLSNRLTCSDLCLSAELFIARRHMQRHSSSCIVCLDLILSVCYVSIILAHAQDTCTDHMLIAYSC